MSAKKPVQYDGEYVLASDGSRDFGEIGAETGLVEGKIRLRTGQEKGEKGDYGEKHKIMMLSIEEKATH